MDGAETVEISMGRASLGRAPVGRSDAEATRGWKGGKPWEIAWEELWWEGALRERREGGRGGNRGN